jgi:hypothetical protein
MESKKACFRQMELQALHIQHGLALTSSFESNCEEAGLRSAYSDLWPAQRQLFRHALPAAIA